MARIPGAGAWPPRPVRSLLKPLGVSGAGMGAMSRALDIISQNIANAETTRTPDGGPYQRQVVVFQRDAAGGVQAAGVVQDTLGAAGIIQAPAQPADAGLVTEERGEHRGLARAEGSTPG